MKTFISDSPEKTEYLGILLAGLLQPGDFVALYGELGSGKTRFAQGVAYGLGVPRETPVTSPTYSLLNIYPARVTLYHFDLYRLASDADVYDAGFDEYFYGDGASLVEWPERLSSLLPVSRLELRFSVLSEQSREIVMLPYGNRFAMLTDALVAKTENFVKSADFF
jgi:tRNA threonylcarbamoyladenosine biosynthesis protein TsaE